MAKKVFATGDIPTAADFNLLAQDANLAATGGTIDGVVVGGTTKAAAGFTNVVADTLTFAGNGTEAAPFIKGAAGRGWYEGIGGLAATLSGVCTFLISATKTMLPSTSLFGWSSASSIQTGQTPDLCLYRDAANTLAQRNGMAAQTHRVYGTYTDASNFRRLTKTMSAAGVAEIKPEGAGTGASGNVLHISGLPTANPGPGILWNDAGAVKVGT